MQGYYKEAKKLKKMVKTMEESERGKHVLHEKEKFMNRSFLLV